MPQPIRPIHRILELAAGFADLLNEQGQVNRRALCRKAGIDNSVLVRAEKNPDKEMHYKTLQAFAGALNVKVADLTGEAEPAAASRETHAFGPDIFTVSIHQLRPAPHLNPRKTFSDDKIGEIAESIAANGLLENLVVRPNPDESDPGTYLIIAGETRYRSLKLLESQGRWPTDKDYVHVKLVECDDAQHIALALAENLQRNDLNPMEEAEGFDAIRALDPKKYTAAEIGKLFGKLDRRYVQRRLELVDKLAPEAKQSLRKGLITVSHARALKMAKPERQIELIKQIGRYARADDLRDEILGQMVPLSRAVFDAKTYPGEIAISEETGNKYFASKPDFLAFQKKAAQGIVDSLAEAWPWVEFSDAGYFNANWNYVFANRAEAKQNACAIFNYEQDDTQEHGETGAVVHFNPADGKVTLHLGLAKQPNAKTNDDDLDLAEEGEGGSTASNAPEPVNSYKAFQNGVAVLAPRLQEALRNDPAGALRLVALLAAFGEDHAFPFNPYAVAGVRLSGIENGCWNFLSGFTRSLSEDETEIHVIDEESDLFDVWTKAREASDDTIAAALASFAGVMLEYSFQGGRGLHPFLLKLAMYYGVDIPDELKPDDDEPQDDDQKDATE